jgi:hypothetical protein
VHLRSRAFFTLGLKKVTNFEIKERKRRKLTRSGLQQTAVASLIVIYLFFGKFAER